MYLYNTEKTNMEGLFGIIITNLNIMSDFT